MSISSTASGGGRASHFKIHNDYRYDPDNPTEYLQAMYLAMTRIRHFEERVAELLEQKEINCPTHLYIGQEAIAAGVCSSLRRDDYVFGNHRSHGHYLARAAT